MSNVINLNRFRKQKARKEKEQHAAENREKFGQTKAEKNKGKAERENLRDHLDQHERAPKDDE